MPSVHGAGSAFVLLLLSYSHPVRPLCSRRFVYNRGYTTMPGTNLCRLLSYLSDGL